MSAHVAIDQREVALFCQRHGIRRLALFGSVLRNDFRDDSDVDVLVEFVPGRVPGLAFFGLQDEMSGLLGRRVDLCTPQCFGPRLRRHVLAEAQTLYGED